MSSAFLSPSPCRLSAHPRPHLSLRRPACRPSSVRAHTQQPTLSTSSPKPPLPDSFLSRYDDLRGADIEPVSATIARFNASFSRPVPIVYRSIINEMLSAAHLAKVCAMWRFDAVFAFGIDSIFSYFLKYYPDDDERDSLYASCVEALGFDLRLIKSSAAAVADWCEGKTQEDVFSAMDAASPSPSIDAVGPLIEALVYVRDAEDFCWYYSRLFGIGVIQVMEAVKTDLNIENAEIWAEKIGFEKSKLGSEMGAYLSSMERLKQAEQIFAEATAREAKKTADRLAAKAEAAAKEAAELEKDEAILNGDESSSEAPDAEKDQAASTS